MPPAAQPASPSPVALICGDEDFAVKQRARQLHDKWCAEVGGVDHETIDAAVGNSGDALKALGKLREALQTLPFFGGGKVVWFKDCSFLGDDRTSGSSAVTEALEGASDLEVFDTVLGTQLNPERVKAWNAYIGKRGWRDEVSAELAELKRAEGLKHRNDIQTFVDYHDVDEGRTPRSA